MTIKVVGAGFGRTGTLSLKMALEQLGFEKCYHMMEVGQHPDHIQLWADAHRGINIDWIICSTVTSQALTGLRATSGVSRPLIFLTQKFCCR